MTFQSGMHSNRGRLLKAAAIAWLLFISAAVVIDHVALSRLTDDMQSNKLEPRLTLLDHRLSKLAQQVEGALDQPEPVTLANLDVIRQAMEARLADMEQAVSTHADIAPLESRLDQFEVRLQEARRTPPPAAPPVQRPAPAKPIVTEPPFQVLSIELRGGERFLSIAPTAPQSLAETRVVRPGETVGGWLLEAINGNTAVFRVDGQARPLIVP
ncbi:MAG: hypothetical protein MK005_18935 [Alcanivorax sp.]|jgi:hypothetical protein|nr:hypothetical protein [Alcanivorax sp.]PHS68261.1 MAG: hypothetical protein COB00_07890 [Alcanivorax sp.]PHS73109.1 MAG: hypothetical protein COB00_00155 [Alcanivorax sp.]